MQKRENRGKTSVATYYTGNYSTETSSENLRNTLSTHETASMEFIAERIAGLLACNYIGEYVPDSTSALSHSSPHPSNSREMPFYFVPNDTLLLEEAKKLGIENPSQLFGGCVPYPFVTSKCITHTLLNEDSTYPHGWSHKFPENVRHVVLRGFTAFSNTDALAASKKLLQHGEIRIKAPLARGGNGQRVVDTIDAANTFLNDVEDSAFSEHGVILETNLREECTRSIGTVMIGSTQISYCGSQSTTKNSRGDSVYGGSSLRAVRGGFNNLLRLDWSKEEIIAIEQAMIYDFEARACFDGFFASRRNYDVAQGYDRGQFCSGVLEQSWRIGGASPAEIAAVEAFVNDSELISVRTSCREIHTLCDVPNNAMVYFRGVDDDVGHITKFAKVDAYEYGSLR